MNTTILPSAAPEPVTLAEAKVGARVDADDTALDGLIAECITAAREQAEHITGRRYRPCVVRVESVDWPTPADPLPVDAFTSCTIRYRSGGAWATLAPEAFTSVMDGPAAYIAPVAGTSFPALPTEAGPRVQIDLATGHAAAEVPARVKLYIKAAVSAWVNSPNAVDRSAMHPNPMHERLLDGERLWR